MLITWSFDRKLGFVGKKVNQRRPPNQEGFPLERHNIRINLS